MFKLVFDSSSICGNACLSSSAALRHFSTLWFVYFFIRSMIAYGRSLDKKSARLKSLFYVCHSSSIAAFQLCWLVSTWAHPQWGFVWQLCILWVIWAEIWTILYLCCRNTLTNRIKIVLEHGNSNRIASVYIKSKNHLLKQSLVTYYLICVEF